MTTTLSGVATPWLSVSVTPTVTAAIFRCDALVRRTLETVIPPPETINLKRRWPGLNVTVSVRPATV